jgi:hypothetical protein
MFNNMKTASAILFLVVSLLFITACGSKPEAPADLIDNVVKGKIRRDHRHGATIQVTYEITNRFHLMEKNEDWDCVQLTAHVSGDTEGMWGPYDERDMKVAFVKRGTSWYAILGWPR